MVGDLMCVWPVESREDTLQHGVSYTWKRFHVVSWLC